MPINKSAYIRYKALDECFRDTELNYDIELLLEKCNTALKKANSESKGVKKRQLYHDISSMESEPFYAPIIKKKRGRITYYRYEDLNFSINSSTNLNRTEVEQIKSAILVCRSLKGLPMLDVFEKLLPKLNQSFILGSEIRNDEVIAFDNNEYLQGIEHFHTLLKYILYKEVLKISYKTFSGELLNPTIHPYFLKQYNNRWFLLGKNPDFETPTNLPLDRIVSIEKVDDEIYKEPTIIFNEYFEDVIGVTIPENSKVEKIEIYADSGLAGYIRTKPLHGSQTPLRNFQKGFKFSIQVIPNPELESLLLSFGEKLKILSPESLKEKIKNRLLKNVDQYN